MAWHDGWMVGLAIMVTLHYTIYGMATFQVGLIQEIERRGNPRRRKKLRKKNEGTKKMIKPVENNKKIY